jgi:uncharacterized membrane protein
MEVNMDEVVQFIKKYRGAIIGIIVAVLLLLTKLYNVILAILLIGACAFLGNYVQKNKDEVKEKLKKIIDRL